ncbi:hypothetical protein GCM10022245_37760 [Streptomyces mayteni]
MPQPPAATTATAVTGTGQRCRSGNTVDVTKDTVIDPTAALPPPAATLASDTETVATTATTMASTHHGHSDARLIPTRRW